MTKTATHTHTHTQYKPKTPPKASTVGSLAAGSSGRPRPPPLTSPLTPPARRPIHLRVIAQPAKKGFLHRARALFAPPRTPPSLLRGIRTKLPASRTAARSSCSPTARALVPLPIMPLELVNHLFGPIGATLEKRQRQNGPRHSSTYDVAASCWEKRKKKKPFR